MENQFITSEWAEFNPSLLVPKIHVSRFDDKGNNRFYFFTDENGEVQTAAGITTWLGKVMPESKFLTDWKLKFGKDWETVLNLTADYGTHLHACIASMMINRKSPDAETIEHGRNIIKALRKFDRSIPTNMIEKNIISFKKFQEDYNLEPLLIEALLVYRMPNGLFYCMTADLLAKITYARRWKEEVCVGEYVKGEKKGQPKYENQERSEVVTEVVSIDFKSNPFDKEEKSFFDSHKFQLIATKRAVFQNFGIKVDRLFNWSPNSWKSESKIGSYNLHEWKVTDRDELILTKYEELASMLGFFTPSGKVEDIDLSKEDSSEMYKTYTYSEYVKKLSDEALDF